MAIFFLMDKKYAWLALVFICIAWGTTYLGIKFAINLFPPFLMAGLRQLSAGLILLFLAFGNKKPIDWRWQNIWKQMLVGFLLITIGNGLVSWAEAFIPSGIAALICGLMPLMAVLMNVAMNKQETINFLIIVGVILGFGGLAINFNNNIADLGNTSYIIGIIATTIATTSWAFGSLLSKKFNANQTNGLFSSAIQISAGGLFLLLISPLIDNYQKINLSDSNGWFWFVYLIIVGSVLAYTAYMYALKHLPVGIVMVYAYINPLVAVLLGWQLADEPLTIYTFASFILIAGGVYLVNRGYRVTSK